MCEEVLGSEAFGNDWVNVVDPYVRNGRIWSSRNALKTKRNLHRNVHWQRSKLKPRMNTVDPCQSVVASSMVPTILDHYTSVSSKHEYKSLFFISTFLGVCYWGFRPHYNDVLFPWPCRTRTAPTADRGRRETCPVSKGTGSNLSDRNKTSL